MAPTRILVTGGTGFLGSEIVSALVSAKTYAVTALDINPPALGTSTFPQVKYVRANILLPEELRKAFDETRPEVVVHTVGVYPLGQARYCMKGKDKVFEINVQGTKNVVDVAKDCGVKALVS